MTASELIEQLQKFPADAELFVSSRGCDNDTGPMDSVEFFSSNEVWIYMKD